MLKTFTIPAAALLGFIASCSTLGGKGSNEKDATKEGHDAQLGQSPALQNQSGKAYLICELTHPPADRSFTVCTREFVSAPIFDGGSCSFKTCSTQNDACPQYYVTKKSSSPPENSSCNYYRPVEL